MPISGYLLTNELAVIALSVFLLGIALIVGMSNKRRPSIHVELFIMVLVGVHILQILIATRSLDIYWYFLSMFAFIPARYSAGYGIPWVPGGAAAYLWTPFSHAFLHFDSLHLFGNGLALFIFGRTVAWRLGGLAFFLLFAFGSAAGAVAHMVFYWGSTDPLAGASAGALGIMGATFRFVPRAEDRLKALFWPSEELKQLPLAGIMEVVTERRSLVYVLYCFIIFPLGLTALAAGTSGNTAVIAHVGGFAFGIFGIGYFDRRKPSPHPEHLGRTATVARREPPRLRMLRVLAFIMMVVGIIMGIVGYYLPNLLRWQF